MMPLPVSFKESFCLFSWFLICCIVIFYYRYFLSGFKSKFENENHPDSAVDDSSTGHLCKFHFNSTTINEKTAWSSLVSNKNVKI